MREGPLYGSWWDEHIRLGGSVAADIVEPDDRRHVSQPNVSAVSDKLHRAALHTGALAGSHIGSDHDVGALGFTPLHLEARCSIKWKPGMEPRQG